jgi:hypothetical protein
MIADIINLIIDSLVTAVNALINIFPDSPFKAVIASIRTSYSSELLGYINYFIPVSEMLAILSVWVTAIVMYYLVSIILRWVKAIS